jgi:hypothetical protein
VDGRGQGFAPDEPNQLIVDGKLPVLAGGFGARVDIEAAEEAVDALVGETAFAQDTNLFDEERICGVVEFGDEGWFYGLVVRMGHLDFAFLLRRRFLPGLGWEDRDFIGTATTPMSGTLRRVETDGIERRGDQG